MKLLLLILPLCLLGCKVKTSDPNAVYIGNMKLLTGTNDPASSCNHDYKLWEEWKPTGSIAQFTQVRYCETCNAMQLRWVQGKAFVQP